MYTTIAKAVESHLDVSMLVNFASAYCGTWASGGPAWGLRSCQDSTVQSVSRRPDPSFPKL